jgi:type II secretory pathway component PulF
MTNPNAAPTSSAHKSPGATPPSSGKGWLVAALACSFFAAIAVTIIGVFVVPKFSAVYASFGANLPLVTRIIIHYYLLIWIVPLAIFIVWRFWPGTQRRNFVVCMIGIGVSVAVIPTFVIAMYLPIFDMAAAA